MPRRPQTSTLFPYTTLFRSVDLPAAGAWRARVTHTLSAVATPQDFQGVFETAHVEYAPLANTAGLDRSEERRVGKECRSRGSPEHEKKKREEWKTNEGDTLG